MIPFRRKYAGPMVPTTTAVQMTAAAQPGITVADNVQLDMGTNSFTLALKRRLADWTPAADTVLYHKHDGSNGIIVKVLTTGVIRTTINATNYDSTVSTGLAADALAWIVIPVVRETASVAGSVTYYINSTQLGAAVTITAGAPVSVDNAVAAYFDGDGTNQFSVFDAGTVVYNRALTAAGVLTLVSTGVAAADRWGSNLSRYSANFSAGTGGTAVTNASSTGNQDAVSDGSTSKNNCLLVTLDSGAGGRIRNVPGSTYAVGRRERTIISYYIPSGQSITNIQIRSNGTDALFTPTPVVGQWTELRFDYLPTDAASLDCRIYGVGAANGDIFYLATWDMNLLGATAAHLPSTLPTSAALAWTDSANANSATLPATNASKVTIRA